MMVNISSPVVEANYKTLLSDNQVKKDIPLSENATTIPTSDNEKLSEDILSITRENQKAVKFTLEGLMDAIRKLNELKSDLCQNPAIALSAQGNISYESVTALL